MNVEGKVVIVTGAARGIGQEYVRALAAAGARPVAADVSDCSETIDLAKSAGGTALSVKCDVADAASTDAMVAEALKAFGRVDALINNAALYGGLKGGRFETITEADWDAAMTINVKGIWNCCKSAVPALRAAAVAASSISHHWPRRSGRRSFCTHNLKGRRDRHDTRTRP